MMRVRMSLMLCVLVVAAPRALAHRVQADAYVDEQGDTITVEAWFGDGDVPESGTVIVMTPDGQEIMRGPLVDGRYVFQPTAAMRYRFDVQLGMGHAKQFALADAELAKLYGGADIVQSVTAKHEHGGASGATLDDVARDINTSLGVIVGLAVIFALTALGMAIAAHRRLQRLEQQIGKGGQHKP